MKETTFALIKPNAMEKNHAGAIISRFQKEGLEVCGLKMIKVSKDLCKTFYQEHQERPFFQELVDFISSGAVIVLALRGSDACLKVREIMGDTDPQKAKAGTLRSEYGDSLGQNAIHGSDSLESAKRELSLFFSSDEIF
ncbi:MAG: nucleoside-diphosphate kinase [Bdellovibrionales bacterium]